MDDDLQFIECPDCMFQFCVIWNNWVLGPPEGFCPYCGFEFPYEDNLI